MNKEIAEEITEKIIVMLSEYKLAAGDQIGLLETIKLTIYLKNTNLSDLFARSR